MERHHPGKFGTPVDIIVIFLSLFPTTYNLPLLPNTKSTYRLLATTTASSLTALLLLLLTSEEEVLTTR